MRAKTSRLDIRELSEAAATRLLATRHVGRIAFAFRDRVDIEPISYVYSDGWLYFRTSEGTKLTTVLHHPYVAFEVDDVESATAWKSVVVHGTIYFLDPKREQEGYGVAVELLRAIDPDLLTEEDATPHRTVLFRVHVNDITGRQATTKGT